MKKFIKMLVLFGLILGGLSVLTDCFISYRLRHSESRIFAAWGDVYNQELHNDILINGGFLVHGCSIIQLLLIVFYTLIRGIWE